MSEQELLNNENNLEKQEEHELPKIEDFVKISISNNKLEAYIQSEPIPAELELSEDFINQLLQKNNIVFGIDYNRIKEVINNRDCSIFERVALGKPSVNGKDGYLTYNFELNPTIKPQLLEDGSVDFHNLNIIQNVEKDSILVTYTPPTDGEDGCTITGATIPAKKGKAVILPKGKNVKLSEDGLNLLAEIDGNVEFVNNKVCISDTLTINQNIDVATGNIYFKGDIIIMGNVLTGFSVTSTGSISVEGFVEAATLRADGDIVLKNGIQGSGKGKLVANGNIVTKFIEMAEVYAKGKISTDAIMNSTVESELDIVVSGRRGFIIGGITRALNRIQAEGLGNTAEIPTIIEVGFTDQSVKKMAILNKDIERLSKELEEINEDMNSFTTSKNKIDLMREKIAKSAEYTSAVKEYKRLSELKEKVGVPKLDVRKTINAGCSIFIKSDVYRVKSTMKSTTFVFSDLNRIVTLPYSGD